MEPAQALVGRARSLLDQLLRIAQTRLELLSAEIQSEKLALTRQWQLAVTAIGCAIALRRRRKRPVCATFEKWEKRKALAWGSRIAGAGAQAVHPATHPLAHRHYAALTPQEPPGALDLRSRFGR
jgi:hypothetical protein